MNREHCVQEHLTHSLYVACVEGWSYSSENVVLMCVRHVHCTCSAIFFALSMNQECGDHVIICTFCVLVYGTERFTGTTLQLRSCWFSKIINITNMPSHYGCRRYIKVVGVILCKFFIFAGKNILYETAL